MPNSRQFLEAMAEDLFRFNILLMPFAFLLAVITGNVYAPLTLVCFLPVLLYHYGLRLFVKKLSPFLFLTWGTCVIGLFTPHYILNTLFLAMLCSHSVKRRTDLENKMFVTFESLCFPLVIMSVLYILSAYFKVPFMRTFLFCQAMAVFVLSLIYVHFSGLNRELEFASADSLQSTKEIADFADKYLLVYLACFIVLIALFQFVPFGSMAKAVCRCIRDVLRFLLSLIKFGNSPEGLTDMSGVMQREVMPDNAVAVPQWYEFLELLMVYLVNILVLVFLIACVVLFFLRLYYGFHRHKDPKLIYLDETSEITPLKPYNAKKRSKHIDDPVRRKFYKKVRKYFKKNILHPSDTPMEMTDKIIDKENIAPLAKDYENARYT